MSADLQDSHLKNISEAKLCEYLGTDKLIEKVTFEAKRATGKSGTGQVPADFYPTCSGMANTLGGTVVFGLEEIHTKEGETRFKVAGIKNPEILKGEAESLRVKPDTLKHEASITKHEADPLEVKPKTLKHEASITKHEADSLEVKPDTLKHEALTERDLLLSSLSEETKMALLKLGKRTRPEIMKDLIREICSQSEFTIDELCIILEKKSRSTFYYKYISELVKEKKLIKTNPEKPTYPNQKYRTVLSQSDRSQKENLK